MKAEREPRGEANIKQRKKLSLLEKSLQGATFALITNKEYRNSVGTLR